jgi:hypothetical protein
VCHSTFRFFGAPSTAYAGSIPGSSLTKQTQPTVAFPPFIKVLIARQRPVSDRDETGVDESDLDIMFSRRTDPIIGTCRMNSANNSFDGDWHIGSSPQSFCT